jgi:hypothetical protein
MARNNPCKYSIEIKPGEFKEFTEAELKDYLLEQDLSKSKIVQDALQERSAEEKVPRAPKSGKDISKNSERVRSSQQRVESSEQNQEYEEALRGITKADNMERRAELGLPVYKNEVVTEEEIRQQAADELAKGYDLNSLIARMEKELPTSAVESEILKIYASDLDARLQENPYDKTIQKELARFTEAKLKSGSKMGRDFRALQGTAYAPMEQLQTLSDFVTVVRDANGVEELTDSQMKKVVEDYENIKKQLEKVNKEKEELERLNIQSLAEKEFEKVKNEAKKTRNVKRDYKSERESVIDNIRKKLKESRESGNLYSSPLPYKPIVDLVKISPDIAKLVKLYAEEGISKLDEVVKNIHGLLKDEVEGLTERDVIDSIAGKYNEPAKPLTEEKANLLNLNREAKLASRLLDLKYGAIAEFPERNKTEKTELVKQREEELKKEQLKQKIEEAKGGAKAQEKKQIAKNREITELEKELKTARKEGGYYDEAKLRAIVKRSETRAKEIEDRIKNKQFEEKAKPETFIQNPEIAKKYPKLYEGYLDGVHKIDLLKHDFLLAAEKDKLEKSGKLGAAKQLGKEFLNTVMALRAGIDNSAVFVQSNSVMTDPAAWGISIKKQKGKLLPKVSISKDKPALNALKFQLVAAASEAAFNRRLIEIHENKPLWNMIEKSGLDILDPKGFKTSMKEESMGKRNLLERAKVAKYITAPFERLFSGFSNEIRVSLFSKAAEELMDQGKTIDNSLQEYKDLASMINNLTGRGKIMAQGAEPYLGAVLWSPKLFASTLNKLGLSDAVSNKYWGPKDKSGRSRGYYSSMTPEGRARAIRSTVRGISTVVLIMAAASFNKDLEVDADPESVTFGQIKNTKTGWSVNLLGPYSSVIRFLTMIGTSAASSLSGGKIGPAQKIGADGKPKKSDVVQEIYKFFRGKANPITGIVTDIATNKTFTGKPYDIKKNLVGDLFEPLFVQDFVKGYQASGTDAILYAIPTFYGLKVQNEKQYDQRDLSSLLDNNVYSNDIDKNTIFNYNDKGRPITNKEFDNFVKERDSYLKDYIGIIHKNGFPVSENGKKVQKLVEGTGPNVATKDQLAAELKRLKAQATKDVKLKLFGMKEEEYDDAAEDVKDARATQGIGPVEYEEP